MDHNLAGYVNLAVKIVYVLQFDICELEFHL